MRVLIVYAHPETKSFNGALRDLAVGMRIGARHEVTVSDLYAMSFAAVIGPADFEGKRADGTVLNVANEQTKAFRDGTQPPDIAAEQEKISRSDLVILQIPMWWFGVPVILKGWADRAFARGIAYAAGRKYDTGLLRGKAAMVSTTTGTSADSYAQDGNDGDIFAVLWPIHNGLLRYCGFEVIEPFVAYWPSRVGLEGRQAYLDDFRARLLDLDRAPRLFFLPAEGYGPNERLKRGVVERSGVQRNVLNRFRTASSKS